MTPYLIIALIAVGAASCSSSPSKSTPAEVGERPELPKTEPNVPDEASYRSNVRVELPPGYDNESSMGESVVICGFTNNIDPATGLQDLAPQLSTAMQAELGRIRRFKIFCAWNDGTYRLAEDLAKLGELANPVAKPTLVDLTLSVSITATTGNVLTRSGNKEYCYQVKAAAELQEYGTRIQVFGRNILGGKVFRRSIIGSGGEPMEDTFDPRDKPQVQKALDESSHVLLYDLVNELGNHYPVTGTVTGGVDDRFGFDRGSQHGIAPEMKTVLWYRGNGVDIPLGSGIAKPGGARSSMVIDRRNEAEASAMKVLSEVQADDDWVVKNPGRLFVTSEGLGVPPDWSTQKDLEAKYGSYQR